MKAPMAAGLLAALAGLAMVAGASASGAGWLGRLVGEAAETGGQVAARGARDAAGAGYHGLEAAARHIKRLPALPKGKAVLAAHVGHEGHWTLVNRAGERFTAASPQELQRGMAALAPDIAVASGNLKLVLSPDTAFRQAHHVRALPNSLLLELHLDKATYPLRRVGDGGSLRLSADVKAHVTVPLVDVAGFREIVSMFARSLPPERLRILSLEPGGPQTLKPRAARDADSGHVLPDAIDPFKLAASLDALAGQTVVISGRVEGRFLRFAPASGGTQSILIGDVTAAAARYDVDLVIVESAQAGQPGARNWLFQKVEVSGLGGAARPATLGDLLEGVAARRGRMSAEVAPERTSGSGARDRSRVRLVPQDVPSITSTDGLSAWMDEVIQNIVGNVVTSAIEIDGKSAAREKELASRIVPGIPSDMQIGYLVLCVGGLMGLGLARGWWHRVWPREARSEYGSAAGYWAARAVKLIVFLLVFLPLVGLPAFLGSVLLQVWGLVLLPFRALAWLGRKLGLAGGAHEATRER